jgi:hypothetical protein
MGRNFRDQMVALELGKTGLTEVAVEQVHRISAQGAHVITSAPIELVTLVFAHDPLSTEEKLVRDALAFCIDRASIRNVLLQSVGEATGGILPNWMSGYGFVFPAEADLPRARREREQVRSVPVWTIGYDASDSISRLLVERIALNARDTGLVLQPTTAAAADLRLVRVPLASADPWIALANVPDAAGSPLPKASSESVQDPATAERLYASEQRLLATQRLIPLFHLPVAYASSKALKGWSVAADGTWRLADAWLMTAPTGGEQP